MSNIDIFKRICGNYLFSFFFFDRDCKWMTSKKNLEFFKLCVKKNRTNGCTRSQDQAQMIQQVKQTQNIYNMNNVFH